MDKNVIALYSLETFAKALGYKKEAGMFVKPLSKRRIKKFTQSVVTPTQLKKELDTINSKLKGGNL